MAARKVKKQRLEAEPLVVPDTIPAPCAVAEPKLEPSPYYAPPDPSPAAPADPEPVDGIKCPACWCRDLRVYRTTTRGSKIVRERRCRHCGRRVMTYESALGDPLATLNT